MRRFKKTFSLFLAACVFPFSFALGGCNKKSGRLKYRVENGTVAIKAYKDAASADVLEIPDEIDGVPVTKIADYAVCNAENLKKIIVGKNVAEIGSWAFTNNAALTEFIVDSENERFCAEDGVLFSKDMKTLLFFPAGKASQNAEYVVPDAVETTRSKAFYKCSGLKKLVLPDGMLYLEEKAFHKCSSLENLVLPNKLKLIGKDAFFGCSSLTSITIPASVEEIGDFAFFNCVSLLSVTVLAEKENMLLGERWAPTNNGKALDKLEIIWK